MIHKLDMDLPTKVSMSPGMDEQAHDNVRALFKHIGCMMEDASAVALIWNFGDALSIHDRHEQSGQANRQISEALGNIKTIIDAD